MEFYDVIEKRRSIRQFEDRAIPQDVLERIFMAGLKAPSSNHQRQWHLVAVTDKERIMQLASCVKPYPCRYKKPEDCESPQQDMFRVAYPRQRTMIEQAACLVLPYFRCKYDLKSQDNMFGLMDYGASWAVIENILLAATAEGVASVVHIPVKKEPAEIEAMVHPKAGWLLPAMILLGYAAKDAETPRQVEVSIQKNVGWNKW